MPETFPQTEVAENLDKRDGFGLYLAIIRQVPFLNAEDETDLSKQIEAGLYAEYKIQQAEETGEFLPEIEDYKTISAEGREATERFILANQGLVITEAKRYSRGHRLEDLQDVIQNGQIGLIRAVRKFDHLKGYKFSSYAMHWIRQSMYRLGRDSLIQLPDEQKDELGRIKRYRGQFYEKNGFLPTLEQVSEEAGSKQDNIKRLLAVSSLAYLSAPIADDSNAEFGDIILDGDSEDAALESLERQKRETLIAQAFEKLGEREQYIMKSIYGFGEEGLLTGSEVAIRLGISRQRVSQIKDKAMEKLRQTLGDHDTLAL